MENKVKIELTTHEARFALFALSFQKNNLERKIKEQPAVDGRQAESEVKTLATYEKIISAIVKNLK